VGVPLLSLPVEVVVGVVVGVPAVVTTVVAGAVVVCSTVVVSSTVDVVSTVSVVASVVYALPTDATVPAMRAPAAKSAARATSFIGGSQLPDTHGPHRPSGVKRAHVAWNRRLRYTNPAR